MITPTITSSSTTNTSSSPLMDDLSITSSTSSISGSGSKPQHSSSSSSRFTRPIALCVMLLTVITALNLLHDSSFGSGAFDPRRYAISATTGTTSGSSKFDFTRTFQDTFAANSTSTTSTPATTSYTLVVVHCQGNIEWLQEVPKEWRIVLYDKCNKIRNAKANAKQQQQQQQQQRQGQNSTTSTTTNSTDPVLTLLENRSSQLTIYSNDIAINAGSEECNGYFNYLVDYYDDLTDVTVFMHDDGLRPYDNKHKPENKHTPFDKFQSVVDSMQFVTPQQPFLHLGLREIPEVWGKDTYHGEAMKILWPYFALPSSSSSSDRTATTTTNSGSATATSNSPINSQKMILAKPPVKLSFKPSAHFAVRKELIQARPLHQYFALLQQFQHSNTIPNYYNARRMCCAMERMWHIFFQQPPMLPKNAIASDLLNITQCKHCHNQQQ